MQAGRTRLQGAQHDAVARQYQAAQEFTRCINGLDRDGRAHHDDDHRALPALRQHMVPSANHGNPAVCAQAARVVVAIGQARLGRR